MVLLAALAAGVWLAVSAFAAPAPPAPTITGKTPSTSPTQSTSISFTFSDSQAGVTFQCALDGGSYSACSSPKAYSSLADGSHTFQVEAVSGGKASSAAPYGWVVDTTAPMLTSISRTDTSPSEANPLRFTLTFSEPVTVPTSGNFVAATGAGVTGTPAVGTPSANGGAAPQATWTVPVSTTSVTGTGAADSTIGLNLTSSTGIEDAAGNTLSTASLTGAAYLFDTAPPNAPAAPAFDSTPPNPNGVSTSTFSWHDTSADVDHYLCSIENGPFQTTVTGADGNTAPCATPLTYVVGTTNNGVHQFAVEAVDAAGDVSQETGYSWKVAKGSIQNFTIDGNAVGSLDPGGPAVQIAVTFHNPNTIPIYVTSLAVTPDYSGLPAGCTGSLLDLTITQASIPAAGVTVPAGGTATLPADGATTPTVQMADNGDQSACERAQITFDYSGSAHS